MRINDRPGDTYEKIVNGYIVTMKTHDDRCSIMHGAGSCNCEADSFNHSVRLEAENRPPKDPPDRLPPICGLATTTYQLTQTMFQVDEILKDLHLQHQPGCAYQANIGDSSCNCSVKKAQEKICAARELLKLE